jgi:hypothetical protein
MKHRVKRSAAPERPSIPDLRRDRRRGRCDAERRSNGRAKPMLAAEPAAALSDPVVSFRATAMGAGAARNAIWARSHRRDHERSEVT